MFGIVKLVARESHEQKETDVYRENIEQRQSLNEISEWQGREQGFQTTVFVFELFE